MKNLFRVLLGLLVMLATMLLAGCSGSYGCQVSFGPAGCTPSGSQGVGSGGGGGGAGGGGGGGGGGRRLTGDRFRLCCGSERNGRWLRPEHIRRDV
jgi:hypothetical protein